MCDFRAACLNKKRPDASQAPGQSREEALPFKGWRIHQFPKQALCQSGNRRRRTGLCRGAGEAALGTNRRWAFPYCRDGGAGRQYAELRSIGIRDYRVLEGRQRVGRIRFVIERMPGVWLWNVTVHLSKVQSADQRMRVECGVGFAQLRRAVAHVRAAMCQEPSSISRWHRGPRRETGARSSLLAQ